MGTKKRKKQFLWYYTSSLYNTYPRTIQRPKAPFLYVQPSSSLKIFTTFHMVQRFALLAMSPLRVLILNLSHSKGTEWGKNHSSNNVQQWAAWLCYASLNVILNWILWFSLLWDSLQDHPYTCETWL